MPAAPRQKLGTVGMLLLAAMSLVALCVAFVVVPAVAKNSDLSETATTYIVAAFALVIALGSTFAARALNKK
jgi:predicted MFS family arabinose efflux permease